MTDNTHGQVPAIQRYKIGYYSDEWGMRSSTPGGIPDASGSWVRYADHVTALKAAQPVVTPQPGAAYADLMQAASDWICEHVQIGTTGATTWAIRLQSAAQKLRASHGQAPAQAAPAYKDSTPETHVGDSAFESWYSTYNPAHKSDKQRAHDAYAAGRVNHKAQAIQGVQWQCGPQASGFTAPQADSVTAPAATCPTCKAPCTTTVNMRGGEHGWGTTDLERTVYHYAPTQAADSVLEDAALPMQPICVASDGVVRFKKNRMVNDMYEFSRPRGFGLNEMARGDYTQEERMQFAQLIGYSVGGYGSLSYASSGSVEKADAIADLLIAARKQGANHD